MSKKELVHGNLRIAFQTNYAPGQERRYRDLPEMTVIVRWPDGRKIKSIAEAIKEVVERKVQELESEI